MIKTVAAFFCAVLVMAPVVHAQDRDKTLADVRQDLSLLFVDVQRLKRELSTTSAPSATVSGGSALDRINSIESELQRLTGLIERLDFKINQIVKDGTNRIGDLEFRLVELEGGDVSSLGQTTTLGGVMSPPMEDTPSAQGAELAVGERADFDFAMAAVTDGNYQQAAELFARFNQNYPSSPLSASAHLERGKALVLAADLRQAATSFLDSFSNYPTSNVAPEALFQLGKTLGQLGKSDEGCQILSQVEIRFPSSEFVQSAKQELSTLSCL